ncbi:MAG: vWA domain-containing protein [Sandaracinus sp.]
MSALRLPCLALLLMLPACTAARRTGDGGPGEGFDGGTLDGRVRGDAGHIDPFDPDAACGISTIPTQQVPGSLLLVFDRSGSMDDPANGDTGPTKWDLAVMAIDHVLTGVPDELSAGLLLFPTGSGDECTISLAPGSVPHVDVAPLSTSRAQISSALASADPSGGNTPMFAALRAGYDYLDTLDTTGRRGLVLVTDGAETCDLDQRDAVLAQVADEHATHGYLTFAVGLDETNNELSTIAYNGGTPRNDTCIPACTGATCTSAADCASGVCSDSTVAGIHIPGQCGCVTDGDCPSPLTCQQPMACPFPPASPLCAVWPDDALCDGAANCCHYDAAGGSFQSDFEAALDEIARRLLESCVFEVPRGTDPGNFDPARVNVGVTFAGQSRTVLARGTDPTMDSWDYVPGTDSHSLVIQGPICDQLLASSATVEIVLGCPTIVF